MFIRIFLGLSLAAMAFPALAGFVNGQTLHQEINAANRIQRGVNRSGDYNEAAHAYGYVVGVVDALQGILICEPESVTAGQLTSMVKKYLDNHPSKWSESGALLVLEALQPSFPCKRQHGRPTNRPKEEH